MVADFLNVSHLKKCHLIREDQEILYLFTPLIYFSKGITKVIIAFENG